MAIYAVIVTNNPEAVLRTVDQQYGVHSLRINPTTALVSDLGTAKTVTQRIGLVNADGSTNFSAPGSALVVAVSSYWGVGDPAVWDWINSRVGGLTRVS